MTLITVLRCEKASFFMTGIVTIEAKVLAMMLPLGIHYILQYKE